MSDKIDKLQLKSGVHITQCCTLIGLAGTGPSELMLECGLLLFTWLILMPFIAYVVADVVGGGCRPNQQHQE